MNLGSLLGGARPLGHLLWWTGPELQPLPSAFEKLVPSLLFLPLLGGSEGRNAWWLAPDFDGQLPALRDALEKQRGWELHSVPVRATGDTLAALRTSAQRFVYGQLATLSAELESLVAQPRLRASVLVRRLDALEDLRRHAALHARHLDLVHERLSDHLSTWAARVDAALCARIVA
jgi:hypothetical protein